MRPRYLEIEGLQSFIEKQTVNFDELSETGLFGIFGPTGSGKSTVLDAITLALYGEVNRALSGTQGIINTCSSAVKVQFDFDLKKEGKYKSFRVERLYQRKKGTENSCEAKVARLIELNEAGNMPIADKPREVTSKVEELIGLRHDDFMRAVVLPQNKFQEFLMLDKYKKREMLERIFYMEEYGKQLTDKVSARLSAVREKLLLMQGELLALGDSSDEALKIVSEDLKNAQQRSRKALEEFRLAEKEYNIARELWQFVSDLGVIENREKEHMSTAEAIKTKICLLDRALKAKSLEDIIGRFEHMSKSYENVVSRLQPLSEMLSGLDKELALAKLSRDSVIFGANEEKKKLIERRMYLNQALEVKNEISAVEKDIDTLRNVYVKLRDGITASDKKIAEKQKTMELLNSDVQSMKKQITAYSTTAEYREQVQTAAKLEESLTADEHNIAAERAHFTELSTVVEALKKRVSVANAEMEKMKASAVAIIEQQAAHEMKKPGERETAANNIEKYHAFKASASMLANKKKEIDTQEHKSCQLSTAVQELKEKLLGYTENRNKLYEKKSALDKSLSELRKVLQTNAAYLLSVELREGEPCPVCGSAHHPRPASGNGDRELSEIEREIRESESAMEMLAGEIRAAENIYTTAMEQLRQNEKLLEQMNNECLNGKNEFYKLSEALCRELTGYFGSQCHYAEALALLDAAAPTADMINNVLEKIGHINCNMLDAINTWYNNNELLKSQLINSNSGISELRATIGSLQAEQKVNLENMARLQSILDSLTDVFNEKSNNYKALSEKLGVVSAVKESASLLEKDTIVEKLLKESEMLQVKSNNEAAALDQLKEERGAFTEKLAAAVNDGKHLKEQKELREARVMELAGDSDIEAGIKGIDDRMLEIERNEKSETEKVELLDIKVKNHTEQKNTMEGQKNTFAASLEDIKSALVLLLYEKGFCDIEEAKKCIISNGQADVLEEEIKTYRQTESNFKAQKELLLKKLDGKSITPTEWEQRQQEYNTKIVEKDESATEFEVARNIFNTIKQKNVRWVSLNNEVKSMEHMSSLLEQIKSLLKGNSFIEYVAEERLRYIAREASGTLGVMTRFRYALELDSDNGFVIRDNASGGVHRPVTSLSGGEVFLTSLSLALALSSQIHLKGQSPLEFFFLDEGFGTLDNNLLDQVIDSLERISTKERMIGLISHVPELKNRITRRLVVEPPGNKGSGSQVRIEKA